MMYYFRNFSTVLMLFSFVLCGSIRLLSQTEFHTAHDSVNWVDSKGMKQGKFRKTDRNGKKIYEGYFRNNNPYGTFRYFDEDGNVTAVSVFSKDGKSCHTRMYHRTGQIMAKGKYVNELRDSIWEFYNADTLVSREAYLAGKKNGMSVSYYAGGGEVQESMWKNGIQEGPYKEFFPDGRLKVEGIYINGCFSGLVTYYCSAGGKRLVAVYKDCLPDGQWMYYHCSSGAFDHKENYKKGKLQGPPLHDIDKEVKDGLEEFKERNEKEHQGVQDKENKGDGF